MATSSSKPKKKRASTGRPARRKARATGGAKRRRAATSAARDLAATLATPAGDLRRGDQGPEVEVLQDELIDLGYLTREDKAAGPGRFGPRTERALAAFQRDNHLQETKVHHEPTRAAFRQLNEGVQLGSGGGVVQGMQDRLVALGLLSAEAFATGPGVFGESTRAALIEFQRRRGIEPGGTLTDETYRALRAAVPRPGAAPSGNRIETLLPASGPGYTTFGREPGGADQFGRAATIQALVELGAAWFARHPTQPFAVGDISRRRGGAFPPHSSHKDGRDADLRPLTRNGVNEPVTISSSNYSPELTRELVELIRARVAGVRILFNDPRLVAAGLTRKFAGHDNHLHVRFP